MQFYKATKPYFDMSSRIYRFRETYYLGVSRLVDKVKHPFSLTYADGSGCPFTWGILVDSIFGKN